MKVTNVASKFAGQIETLSKCIASELIQPNISYMTYLNCREWLNALSIVSYSLIEQLNKANEESKEQA